MNSFAWSKASEMAEDAASPDEERQNINSLVRVRSLGKGEAPSSSLGRSTIFASGHHALALACAPCRSAVRLLTRPGLRRRGQGYLANRRPRRRRRSVESPSTPACRTPVQPRLRDIKRAHRFGRVYAQKRRRKSKLTMFEHILRLIERDADFRLWPFRAPQRRLNLGRASCDSQV